MNIDYSKDSLFDAHGIARLRDSYMRPEETSPQDRFAYVAKTFSSNDTHAQRMYDYMANHWWSNSTPILSFGRTKHGLPISCFLPWLPDTSDGLLDTSTECRALSMAGGGIGLGVGLRSNDDKSTGVMPHLKTYDDDTLAFRQGTTRRGSIAAYLDISHPDILKFLDMRKPTGGDPNQKCLNLHHGVNIPEEFMDRVYALSTGKYYHNQFQFPQDPNLLADLDKWPLIDPNSKQVKQVVSVKDLWQKLLTLRISTGEPYLHFISTTNDKLPKEHRNLGLSVRQSNLCTEITLPTDEHRTAVCCLGSLNLEHWADWKDHPTFISDCVEFLDNVLEYFITHAPDRMIRAKYSASRERSIGIGAMGFHALLQKNMIAFESPMAYSLNMRIFKHIKEKTDAATRLLAIERGACPDSIEGGEGDRRNIHLVAIAPNASSSIIMGNTSPSVEPYRANYFVQDTLSGSFVVKNKYLEQLLESRGLNTDATWNSILRSKGSVLHLEGLTNYEKSVFKTAIEIDQQWIVEHAAVRQQFIDQAQSINLFFEPTVDIEYLHNVHINAWIKGLKTLYYCRSEAVKRAENVGALITREIIPEEACLACE